MHPGGDPAVSMGLGAGFYFTRQFLQCGPPVDGWIMTAHQQEPLTSPAADPLAGPASVATSPGGGAAPAVAAPTAGVGPQGKWTVSPPTRAMQIRRLAWAAVETTLYRLSFHTWNGWRAALLRLFGAKVGRNVVLRRTSQVFYPWLFTMGDNSVLGDRAEIYNLGPITVGQRVTVSQQAYVCAGSHDYTDPTMPLIVSPVVLGDDSWICTRAFVSPGVTVGAGAIIAAMAVVTRDVAPWTIVAGNPAKFVKGRPPLRKP